MQHNKAVEQLVVPVNTASDLIPSLGIDTAAIEQSLELQDRVSHLAAVSADRSPETLHCLLGATVIDYDLERFRPGAVVEGWPWGETGRYESSCL